MLLYKSLGGHAITASIVEEAWGGQTYGFGRDIHYPSMMFEIIESSGYFKSLSVFVFHACNQIKRRLHISALVKTYIRAVKPILFVKLADKIICYSMMPWKNVVRYYDESKQKYKKIKVNTANKTK